MSAMKDLELRCSELVLELEELGYYGLGYFAGVLVERRPALADALKAAIELNQEELKQ